MEFMLIMYEGQEEVPAGLMPEMGEFAGKLAAQGKMRGGRHSARAKTACASGWKMARLPSSTGPSRKPGSDGTRPFVLIANQIDPDHTRTNPDHENTATAVSS